MYAAKPATITLLSALFFLGTASPLDVAPARRAPLANVANVNLYSDSSCGGSVESFTVTGGSVCHAVSGPRGSIEVSENNCATYTWSGSNCAGSSLHISGDQCTAVQYASVSVQC